MLYHKGMLTFDSDRFTYSNIRDMYCSGNAHGLQVSKSLEQKYSDIMGILSHISSLVYRLDDICKDGSNSEPL